MLSWSGDTESGSDPTSRQPNAPSNRRSRSGCFLCRARKVKCDERWPSCLNCERLRLDCPGHPGQVSFVQRAQKSPRRDATLTQAGTRRHRVSKSCHYCRLAKARCSGGERCTRCIRKDLECTYSADRIEQVQSRSDSESHPGGHDRFPGSIPTPHPLQTIPEAFRAPAESEPSSMSWYFSPPALPMNPNTNLARLHSPQLPDKERIIMLVEEYFAHVHPLRCFGFVHKPSFMQRLSEDLESCCNDESLLHIICALGAKFFALDYSSQFPPESILTAGNQWAKIAKARIFADLDDLCLEKLMTAILLYDHDLRIGSYASAFILSGITARISQALQLNLESSADILCAHSDSSSPIMNESKRRLMWSCYVMDSWVGSGVNQLTLLEDKDLKIQLPCHSHNFSLGTPCITELIDVGKVLKFIPKEQTYFQPAQNMGIEAYFIRLVSIRKRVLRYVKHLEASKPPWEADSEFQQLSSEFESWRVHLPQSLKWHSGAIWARKESSQLGALTLLWCTYHQTLVDLYRIGMPILFRIRQHVEFPSDKKEFLDECCRVCFNSAREVSKTIAEASKHGIKALADTWLCIIAHDSIKVMLYYLRHMTDSSVSLSANESNETITLVKSNLEALMQMRPLVATAEHCYLSAAKIMASAGPNPKLSNVSTGERAQEENEEIAHSESPVQESPEAVLNPLAIYRMARTALRDKDTRGSTSGSPSTTNTTSPGVPQSRMALRRSHQNLNIGALHPRREQPQHPYPSHIDERSVMLQPFESASSLMRPEDPSLNSISFPQFPAFSTAGLWDPAEMGVMNMLDDGNAPWTVEYLTNGQSRVDPFLFPF